MNDVNSPLPSKHTGRGSVSLSLGRIRVDEMLFLSYSLFFLLFLSPYLHVCIFILSRNNFANAGPMARRTLATAGRKYRRSVTSRTRESIGRAERIITASRIHSSTLLGEALSYGIHALRQSFSLFHAHIRLFRSLYLTLFRPFVINSLSHSISFSPRVVSPWSLRSDSFLARARCETTPPSGRPHGRGRARSRTAFRAL